jgi:PAS domain S-box-containing protein
VRDPKERAGIQRLEAHFQVISRITRAFAEKSTDYERLLDTIARELAVTLKDTCRVQLLTEDGETLETVSIHSCNGEAVRVALEAASIRVSENPLLGEVLRSGKSATAVSEMPATTDERARTLGPHRRLIVPLRVNGEAVGVLAWGRFSPDSPPFDEHDRELAELLAEHAAPTIANARVLAAERAARQRLASAEARYRALLDGAQDMIAVMSEEGAIVEVNRAWEQAMGVPREQAKGRRPADFAPESVRNAREAEYTAFIARGGVDTPPPVPVRQPDGSVIQVEATRSLVDVGGGKRLVLFIGRDVTERLRLAEQLHEAQIESEKWREMARQVVFDATVAEERQRRRIAVDLHDRIGQQLALAKISLASVREGLPGGPRSAVENAAVLLAQTIDDTRSLAFDLSPPVLYDLGLKEALCWLAEDVEQRHGMKLEVADDGTEKPLDDASKAILFRAVRELIMNVLKHAHAKVTKVSLGRMGDQVQVVVEDDGIGFDVQAWTQGRTGGSFGLLSIHEQIACLAGTLSVESAPAEGTCVSLCIPLRGGAP